MGVRVERLEVTQLMIALGAGITRMGTMSGGRPRADVTFNSTCLAFWGLGFGSEEGSC